MPETSSEPLSGHEIIEDFLDQIRTKLKRDCNLRDSDAYGGGYEANVKLSLKLFALDNVEVNHEFTLPAKLPPPESTEQTDVFPVTIEETVVIPREEDLIVVRERIGQGLPPEHPAPTQEEQDRMPVVAKRQYRRKLNLAMSASGGAVNVDE